MNPARLRLEIHLALTLIGAVICAFISIPAALILAAVSLLILISDLIFLIS